VTTRKGYALKGNGFESGVSAVPPKICTATIAKSTDAMKPVALTKRGIAEEALTRARPAAQSPTPAPKDGELAARSIAALETTKV
jgi:hypothetical protein